MLEMADKKAKKPAGKKGKEPQTKAPTEFINKISTQSLDKFIEEALEVGKIDEVLTLDLSRKKLNELSPKIRFYFRMLRNLVNLNLYCNKLRTLPPEIGSFYLLFGWDIGLTFSFRRAAVSHPTGDQ